MPYLFSMFVDLLLAELNEDASRIPKSLFYVDDGIAIAKNRIEIRKLID